MYSLDKICGELKSDALSERVLDLERQLTSLNFQERDLKVGKIENYFNRSLGGSLAGGILGTIIGTLLSVATKDPVYLYEIEVGGIVGGGIIGGILHPCIKRYQLQKISQERDRVITDLGKARAESNNPKKMG